VSKWTASLLERLVTLKRWLIYWSVLDSEKTVKYEIFFIERETLYILLFLGYILGIFGWKFYNLKILPVCWQNCGRFKIGRWWWWPKERTDVANCWAGQSNFLVLIFDIFLTKKRKKRTDDANCQTGQSNFFILIFDIFFDWKKKKKTDDANCQAGQSNFFLIFFFWPKKRKNYWCCQLPGRAEQFFYFYFWYFFWPKKKKKMTDVANCQAGQSNFFYFDFWYFFWPKKEKNDWWCQLPGRAEQFFGFDFWYFFWPKKKKKRTDDANCLAGQSNFFGFDFWYFFWPKKKKKKDWWCQLPGRAEQFFYFDFWYFLTEKKKKRTDDANCQAGQSNYLENRNKWSYTAAPSLHQIQKNMSEHDKKYKSKQTIEFDFDYNHASPHCTFVLFYQM